MGHCYKNDRCCGCEFVSSFWGLRTISDSLHFSLLISVLTLSGLLPPVYNCFYRCFRLIPPVLRSKHIFQKRFMLVRAKERGRGRDRESHLAAKNLNLGIGTRNNIIDSRQ